MPTRTASSPFLRGHDTEYQYIVGSKFGNNLHKEWYLNNINNIMMFVEVQNVAITEGCLVGH